MARKIAVDNPEKGAAGAAFSWGLRVADFSELYLVTGTGDVDQTGQVRHHGDPLAQARAIVASMKEMLDRAGYTLDDVIRVETTVTREFDVERNLRGLLAIWAETFKDVKVKPSAGVLRVVDALALPGMLVEIQLLAAL